MYKKEEEEVARDQLVARLRELLYTYNTDKMNGKVEFEKPEEDKEEEKGGRGKRGEKGAAKEPKEPKEKKEGKGKKEAPKEAAKEEKIEPATENK